MTDLAAGPKRAVPAARSLTSGWTVRPVDPRGPQVAANWPVAATVPGSVHADLTAAGVIPDPHVDANELAVRWVADIGWEYQTCVTTDATTMRAERLDLVFDGLDTIATVIVNGHEIAQTQNMHRTYRFDVTALLRQGDNELVVRFASATAEAEHRRSVQGYWPSQSFDQPFNMLRKMACAWGWDWGLQLTTIGIWRDVRLEPIIVARLDQPFLRTTVDASGAGAVQVEVAIDRAGRHSGRNGNVCACHQELSAELRVWDPDGNPMAEQTHTVVGDTVMLEVAAPAVRRWWPIGHGDQPLYQVDVVLSDLQGNQCDRWSRQVGFRTVVLDTGTDDIGRAFTVIINDRPLFVRGVNWIPDDMLPSQVTADRYTARLDDIVELDANLVRVWGGGIYESDAFYELCDQRGLLVWQDFLFACAAYPESLLDAEVEGEARDNVQRLMSHPSLVVWCGNNENLWGAWDWGWQARLDGRAWGEGFYRDLLPRIVAEIDGTRPYTDGSPTSVDPAVHPNADTHGSRHVWDVWNQRDYRTYRDYAPRFVSEFGWQAPPTLPTLRRSITDRPLRPDSPGMQHHQKAEGGNAKLIAGLAPFFDQPQDFDSWVWAMQLNQARAVRTGTEHFRSLHGRCMGTIWWQHNDCWPVTSWSVLDSDGGRKPAWYALQAAYRPHLLTLQPRDAGLALVAVNDGVEVWDRRVTVTRRALDSQILASQTIALHVPGGSAATIMLDPAVVTPQDSAAELIYVDPQTTWWFRPDRELALPPAHYDVVATAPTQLHIVAQTILVDAVVSHPADSHGPQLLTLLPGSSMTVSIPEEARIAGTPPRVWTANDLIRREE